MKRNSIFIIQLVFIVYTNKYIYIYIYIYIQILLKKEIEKKERET